MASSPQENIQWLSVTEETLFLHDGLIRVTDLVELPKDVNSSSEGDGEVISFDLKNPAELSNRLLSVCGTHNNAYSKLLEYRLNALKGLWNAQKQIAVEEESEKESSNTEETIAVLKKQGLWKEPEQASFSTRISVLLVLPLLQSQSRLDPHLCGVASGVLLNCLHDCAPLSLSKEPGDCLKGLENLLCSWLGEKNSKTQCEPVEDLNQRRTIASALVALACARGHLKTFIHTVHLLQKLPDLQALPVGDILTKLLETEGGQGHVPAILGSKHVLCWGFEDLLSGSEKESGEKDKADGDIGRSLASDGVFLYTTNACGRGLAKIGSGLHGSIRGYVYSRNPDIGPGKVAYGDGQILYRPLSYDQEGEQNNFFQVLDKHTLQTIKTIPRPEQFTVQPVCTTIAFCSDSVYFYWIWCPAAVSDKNAKGIPVYMESFKFKSEDGSIEPLQPRITLTKKDETSTKALNDTLLSRLRPSYRGSFNTLAQIVGVDNGSAKKDEGQAAGSTSCGVLLKVLVKTPVFVDGSHVVLLTPLPGGAASNAARSLFGSTGGLASLRSLASNFCFTIRDGQFSQRPDLSDAPNCSLARGAPLASLGTCFDVYNNVMWCCSSDWVDQFCNPGHQAPHHVKQRLGIGEHTTAFGKDNQVEVSEVIKLLLQHVGGMCLHLIQSDRLYTPLGAYMLQQYPVDFVHLERVWDILQSSLEVGHSQTVICALIVLQLVFRESVVKTEKETEQVLLQRTRELVWKLLVYTDDKDKPLNNLETIQREACVVITNGLNTLYPTTEDKNTLMLQLLRDNKHPGLGCLKDMLLIEFADQLKCHAVKVEQYDYLRLTDDINQLLLKIAVKESCSLLEQSLNPDKDKFEQLLSEIPVATPCQRYLIALQSHVLREAVLFTIPEDNKSDIDTAKTKLKELQTYIQKLATKVFQGACQVLEMLLETCNKMISDFKDNLENRFQGLEKVAKATILGHLIPPLLTSLTHENLSCLPIADVIMPQLVQLVVLSSQAALLLKSQAQAVMNDDLDIDSDSDVVEIIGQSVTPEKVNLHNQEEQGFLTGLKIPAPWSSGKTIESIHPVRDNYKFKETVHIPGARCLYLRFDSRCSSQYDYDKMVIHAGGNTTSKKVAEYGGNTFGFGSRSVLGSGWPKDLVRVEGDTVTFSFEMRSGREHNTPDKAMWGFHVTVRAQESPEEVSIGLPFLADLGLGLSVLSCTMLHLLYQGQEKTKEEESCQHLLKSKLLQRCVWQSGTPSTTVSIKDMPLYEEGQTMSPKSPKIPRIRLPTEIMRNLLTLSHIHQPHMRPSVREAIQYDVMQECLVSAVVKHLGLQETVRYFTPSKEQQTDDFMLLSSVMEEVCRRFDALIRQLQFLGDLEQRWYREVQDFKQEQKPENPPFFHDYHLQDTKLKELSMLCFVKDVQLEPNKTEDAAKELREKFTIEVESNDTVSMSSMPCTKQLVEGIMTRLDLLLHVNISPADTGSLTRTISQNMEGNKTGPSMNVMVRSDTDVLGHSSLLRSQSAPLGVDHFQDDTALDFMRLHRRRPGQKYSPTSILQGLVEDNEEKGKPPHVILIGQLFSFIGSEPQKAISCEAFLQTAHLRWWRGNTRKQALVHMKELLSAASRVGGATHLVAAVTSVLRHGPRIEELTCGGMVNQVREAFAETMTSVVQLAARYPIACCNSIGLLCIVPYTRAEEKCLVRSGLVHLLDRLCSLANYRGDVSLETQSTRQKVSAMAWAGFQVLADRCVMWETEEGSQFEELEHSGLARQVSVLLTNHLARATECGGNEAAGTEALQEVLSLLNNLSRSNMGKAILSQPACVSKLLSLLLDQRPSPKLVLIILQLCRVALPLMEAVDCEQVELPNWSHAGAAHWSTTQPISDPPAKIVSLLLARLGDFLVPGDLATVASRQHSVDTDINRSALEKDKTEDTDIQNGRLSVFVHKRDDQFSHEVIQPLLSSESRPFRLGGGSNMEKVVRLDREMTKNGKAEIATEDAIVALRKAAKWAQQGFVVSTGPPVDLAQAEVQSGDKKKADKDVICREKNAELARTDPVRQFISGHVANSMAAEVIELLHSLMNAPVTTTARSWAEVVQRVLVNALSSMPVLLNSLGSLSSPRCHVQQLMSMGRHINAALCALGGFKEMVKPGCHVTIRGDEIENTTGTVLSVSQVTGLVSVKLDTDEKGHYSPRYSEIVEVPKTRVLPSRNQMFSSQQSSMTDAIVTAIQSILLPQEENQSPLQVPLPVTEDGSSLTNQVCRVVAELETRACMVLALYLEDIEFTKEFIQHCGSSIDMLKSLAKDCSTGERQQVVESHCERLRLLYRDCAKPPPPPSKVDNRNKEIVWDTTRAFPPARASLFCYGLTGITFLGDPSAGSGLPRGTMVYANMPIPLQAPSFYWELEICSFGDGQEESSAFVSFGFAPSAEKKDGAWTNPIGTCLFLNNGKAVHYNGASLLQWRSVRLDVSIGAGDIAGVGWERTGNSPAPGQTPKGKLYFTYNGRKLPAYIDDVSGAMFPVVHIQKKNTRVKANFGARPFAFAEGQQHREAADEANDLTREIRESFSHLPFNSVSDSEEEGTVSAPSAPSSVIDPMDLSEPLGPPCKTVPIPKPLKEYSPENCKHYKLFSSYDSMITTGPDQRSSAPAQDTISDEESNEEDQSQEDHYALLVKAWEQKVFPTIKRRFRNEAERKDGLEQIRGALQLGMTDIARQTVEFLYEENGGMPRDLHLPTIDDIKEDLAKFTIDRVRKGTTVIIRDPKGSGATTLLPKYAVRSMLKTFGLTGTVLDIDNSNELVQVETYLRSEGVLVRYWYPLSMLEKPPQGLRKSTITGGQILDTSNVNIHRELVRSERTLARMFCRKALLKLVDHCNSSAMDVISCSATLTSGMAASAAVLQELDIENIQLLSNELLRAPQPHGTITAKSLTMTDSSRHCLAAQSCSLSNLLYRNVDRLKKELAIAIARAARQGEDYLIELTNQICICLQTAPEMFPFEEYPVTEAKTTTDIHFPGAACLIVSCKTDPKATKKDTSLYKSPWARVYCYTGRRLKKTGQISKQEVVSYPRDTSSTSNQVEQYTPAIIPCDKIHLRVGVSPPPGIIVTIHALPPQFLLAITYIETLITEQHGCGTKSCPQPKQEEPDYWEQAFAGDVRTEEQTVKSPQESLWNLDNIVITPMVFSHMIEQFCGYMWRTEIPALVKEYLFHLLAQSIRVLHYSEGCNGTKLPTPQPHMNPSQGLLIQLHNELQVLHEAESKSWASATTSCGAGIGIGVTDQGRFSTYFHALMEANLAVGEIAKPNTKPKPIEAAVSLDVIPKPPTSPTHTSRRKKLKTKRKEGSHRRSEAPSRASESDGDMLPPVVLSVGSPTPTSAPQVVVPSQSASSSDQTPPYATASSSSSSFSLTTPSSGSTSSSFTSASASSANQDTKDAPPVKSKHAKHEDVIWFHRALTVSHILRCLAFKEKNGTFYLVSAINEANQVLNTVTAHQRLVIITGIPTQLEPDFVRKALLSVLKSHGGADRDEIFLPYDTVEIPIAKEGTRDAATGELIPEKKTAQKEDEAVESGENIAAESGETVEDTKEMKKETINTTRLKGYAVMPVLSKTKIEGLKKSLLKNRTLFEGNSIDQNDPSEMPTISTVSQNLVAEEENANDALEHFLRTKLFQDERGIELSDAASLALTEIFHSCFIVEQRHGSMEFRQESGYICLGMDQILQHTPENLLCTFFNNIRPLKKSLTEQVLQTLRRYGTLRTPDKESSPVGEKQGKGKGKKPQRSAKEKVVMVVEKPSSAKEKDKKPKEKPEQSKSEKEAGDSSAQSAEKTTKQATVQKEEDHCLTLDGFLQFVLDHIRQDVRSLWRAILSCGFDIHMERCACLDSSQAQQMARQWTLEMDTALTQYVNSFSRKLGVAPARLHPHEIYISQAELTNERYVCLQGVPLESVRLRFAFLQSLNNTLESFFLPLVDLRPSETYSRSMAALLAKVRGLIFYDTKCNLANRVLNATAKRKPDQAAPEITLDPLEVIGGEKESAIQSMYCQAYRQLSEVASSQLCVRLACGGDPTYSFNVKFTGEEVHGTSGSFRHFLWQIAKELQGPLLNILVPSSNTSIRGKCILQPGPFTLSEERLIIFLGQLLGITIRADIPMGLDLSPSFWKALVGLELDPVTDIKEADPLTYSYMKKIEMIDSEPELYALCADVYPTFMYPSLSGEEVELIPGGRNTPICWENRHQYVDAIRRLRLLELTNPSRLQALRAGLASILPLQLMTIMSPYDIELRTCGLPQVDIEFLKAHTMYQVGLTESDTHIEYFWNTLEGMSQDDLSRFIKFACNQERIPMTCPCKEGSADTTHVPPYPMKIAPPDVQDLPDSRYIRVETCMFMIKLPQYSTQEIMTQRLMYAIHCREDPLSG